MNTVDLAWTVGFLEGEGSFGITSSLHVNVSNTDREPLAKLHKMYGGSLTLVPLSVLKPRGKESPCFRWQLCGVAAAGLMMTCYPMMTRKRRVQIGRALSLWRLRPAHPKYRHTCKYGHALADNHYVVRASRGRKCKTCAKRTNRANYLRITEGLVKRRTA